MTSEWTSNETAPIVAEIAALESELVQAETQEASAESTYSRDELMAGAAGFGVDAHVIAGALALAGKTTMTRAEAEAAIRAFQTREVTD